MGLERDFTVDFTNVDSDGLTHASMRDAVRPDRVVVGAHLVVGDDDADPAVARVVDVNPDSGIVLLNVLPGHAEEHQHLVEGAQLAS